MNQIAKQHDPDSATMSHRCEHPSSAESSERLDVHVVILNNCVRAHHVAGYRELAKRVRKLTILLSVSTEPDRDWVSKWTDLDVRIQKNWTWHARYRHRTGFRETSFIHVPIDTISQLKSLKPDIIFSYEMGMRTMLSCGYRRFRRQVPLVMVGNMAEHIEKDRGPFRKTFRWLLKRGVDYFTFNGPSCQRYLQSLAIPDDRLFHLPYCIDPQTVFCGDRNVASDSDENPRRLFYGGVISERKGILQFATGLRRWCQDHPTKRVQLTIAGTGELKEQVAQCSNANFAIEFLGNCDAEQVRNAYGQSDICLFPSLADEWGLVPIEAMASGIPVLGSKFAQSVETVVSEGSNGWIFDPTDSASIDSAIARAMKCTGRELFEMGQRARSSVANISASVTAGKFIEIITTALPETCSPRGADATGETQTL